MALGKLHIIYDENGKEESMGVEFTFRRDGESLLKYLMKLRDAAYETEDIEFEDVTQKQLK